MYPARKHTWDENADNCDFAIIVILLELDKRSVVALFATPKSHFASSSHLQVRSLAATITSRKLYRYSYRLKVDTETTITNPGTKSPCRMWIRLRLGYVRMNLLEPYLNAAAIHEKIELGYQRVYWYSHFFCRRYCTSNGHRMVCLSGQLSPSI